jgi:hypothetical protein
MYVVEPSQARIVVDEYSTFMKLSIENKKIKFHSQANKF